MLSILTNVINNENKTSTYISRLRSKNIEVLPPNINISLDYYIIKDKLIKKVGI